MLTESKMRPIGLSSAAIAIVVSILWGGNIVSIRIGVDSVPPLWSAFWRMLLGVVFVGVWALGRGVSLKTPAGEAGPLTILGVLFTIQIALLNYAAALTSPAYGVVILNSYAIFANLAGHFFARHSSGAHLEEPLTRMRIFGLVLALAGVAILAVGQPPSSLAPQPLVGNGLMILSSLLLGVRQVYTRWLVQTIDPVRTIVWQMLLSVPLFLLIAAVSEPPLRGRVTTEALLAIAYQGIVVAGLCFILWAKLLRHHSAGALSMYAFLVPISGIALSAIFFNEPILPTLILGGILVLAGVYTVSR